MRVFLDACVLYPTILRGMLIDFAQTGAFIPLWSDGVVDEWQHAAKRNGHLDQAVIEKALFCNQWSKTRVTHMPISADIALPDPNDIHVLEAALGGKADLLVTANLRDFPTKTLARLGLEVAHPDAFLAQCFRDDPIAGVEILRTAHRAATHRSGKDFTAEKLLKQMRLPRLRRALLNEEQP